MEFFPIMPRRINVSCQLVEKKVIVTIVKMNSRAKSIREKNGFVSEFGLLSDLYLALTFLHFYSGHKFSLRQR